MNKDLDEIKTDLLLLKDENSKINLSLKKEMEKLSSRKDVLKTKRNEFDHLVKEETKQSRDINIF